METNEGLLIAMKERAMKSGIRRVRRARARHKREQRFLYGYYMLLLIVSVIIAGMIVGCGMAAAHVKDIIM